MNPTLTLSRYGFLDLPEGTPPKHFEPITRARSSVEGLISELRRHADEVRKDPDLTPSGKDGRCRAAMAEASKALGRAFSSPRAVLSTDADRAAQDLQARLWHGVDDEHRLDRARSELFALVQRDPISPREIPTDGATGAALLASGGRVLSLLDDVLRSGDLSDARLLVLSALRGGPILKALVGGKPVMDAMVNTITERVVEADPEAARLAAERDSARSLLSTIEGDQRSALRYCASALGLPKEAADAIGRADPVAEAARAGNRS